jgi:nucleotide-binding universal stress UspA family protein
VWDSWVTMSASSPSPADGVDGEPANALLAAAEECKADLIGVGALRDSGIADRLLGTVAAEVVRRAPCEVLVVRPRSDAAHQPPAEERNTN